MTTINQLPLQSSVTSGDQIALWTPGNGDTRRCSIGALMAFFQTTFASPGVAVNLYTPGTGFSIAIPTPVSNQQWVILQPAAGLADGTLTLPLASVTPDGTEVLITSTQQITAFTLAGNGAAAVYGAPTTLGADDWFRMRFYQPTNSWYRIA